MKICGFDVLNYQEGAPVNVIGLSGGKDSIALALLSQELGLANSFCVFNDTGNEHPMTYEYIAYLKTVLDLPLTITKADFTDRIAAKRAFVEAKWAERGVSQEQIKLALENLVPSGNPFLDLCKWKGRFPSTKTRFCTQELKVLPFQDQVLMPLLRAGHEVIMHTGVRADESEARSKLQMTEYIDPGYTMHRPLLHWTAEQCFEMTAKHGVKNNPLYQLGMGRVGCMPCIMARKGEIREIANRFPEVVDRIHTWEGEVAKTAKRAVSTFFPAPYLPVDPEHDCPTCHALGVVYDDEAIEHVCPTCQGASKHESDTRSSIHKVVAWSRTTRGGAQFDIFADEAPTCSSIYGLCE